MIDRQESTEHPGQEGQGIRINQFLARQGYCSRREADRLVAAGAVTIDGQAAQLGSRVSTSQVVRINGRLLPQQDDLIYIVLYKPIGITCTTDARRRDNIIAYLGLQQRVFPIGRLDRDSEGLLFLSNDGSIVNKILKSGNRHEKEYRVTVDKPITEDLLERLSGGVPILDTVTRPCPVFAESHYVLRIILTQGLNRQIRRMCEACGYTVRRLTRIRIMHITIDQMKPGQWRYFTDQELQELQRRIQNSKT